MGQSSSSTMPFSNVGNSQFSGVMDFPLHKSSGLTILPQGIRDLDARVQRPIGFTDTVIQVLHAKKPKSEKNKGGLKYPGDCDSKTLRGFAEKIGLKVLPGGDHFVVKDPVTNEQVTTIPHKMKDNGTCRGIIDKLNLKSRL